MKALFIFTLLITPIIDAVHSILYENVPAASAMRALLDRDPRPEHD